MEGTQILTKKDFLQILKNTLIDTDVILLTNEKAGSITAGKGLKKVTFAFAGKAFKEEKDIRDLAFKIPCLAFCICSPEDVSADTEGKLKVK